MAASTASWRWMLKRDFMVINMKRQVGDKKELGKEIVGWDAKSGQLVHWLFWEGGFTARASGLLTVTSCFCGGR